MPQPTAQLSPMVTPMTAAKTPLAEPSQRQPMNWLFLASFEDGTVVAQTQADKSTHTDNKSAFHDVQSRIERGDKLISLELQNTNGKDFAAVNLLSGDFIINDVYFNAHDQNFDPSSHDLKAIYYTETRVEQNVTIRTLPDGSTIAEPGEVGAHYANRYFIGWQAKGTKHKAIIAVG